MISPDSAAYIDYMLAFYKADVQCQLACNLHEVEYSCFATLEYTQQKE